MCPPPQGRTEAFGELPVTKHGVSSAMSQSEETEKGIKPTTTTVHEEPHIQTKPQSQQQQQHGEDSSEPGPSSESMRSDFSKEIIIDFPIKEMPEVNNAQPAQEPPVDLDAIFSVVKRNIGDFVEREIQKHQEVLNSDPQCLERHREDEDDSGSRDAFLKILVHFLKRVNQEELANILQS
ncbi:protein NLRC3-like isoform X1, partial [Lates japonicus]